MEYLVTMTTRVPPGTSSADIDAMRVREARRAAELADAGWLLRLWRPPLLKGEWRTLGLFSAPDEASLERALASMPLRVWREDAWLPLSPHANDPACGETGTVAGAAGEFLLTMTVTVPVDASPRQAEEMLVQEAMQARELAGRGYLRRLWSVAPPPGTSARALGLWRAQDAAALTAVVDALPLRPWMEVETVVLAPHPSDPAVR